MYSVSSGKKDYSGISADVKTYYSGMGYAIAHEKRGINFSDAKSRSVFQKGYNAGKKRLANNPSRYFKLKRKRKKKGDLFMRITRKWKNILSIALAALVLFGAVGAVAAFATNDSKPAGAVFKVGGLDPETGKYVKTDKTIYTEEAIDAYGLRIEPDFESTVTYDVYYYDENKDFLEKKVNLTEFFVSDFDLAKYARIVIHPEVPEDVDKRDFKVSIFDVLKYSSMLKITVAKDYEWYSTKNLISEDDFILDKYFGDVEQEVRDYNSLVEDEWNRKVTGKMFIEKNIKSYDIWVYVSASSNINSTFCLFGSDGVQLRDENGNRVEAFITDNEVSDRPRWVCVTLEVPYLESYEGVFIAGQISGDNAGVYVYGN